MIEMMQSAQKASEAMEETRRLQAETLEAIKEISVLLVNILEELQRANGTIQFTRPS